jgi:MgtE intracellular N domain
MNLPGGKSGPSGAAGQRKTPAERLQENLAARRAVSGQMISLARLLGRPLRDKRGVRVARIKDVVARWDGGAAHPPVVGVLVSAGKGLAFVAARDLTFGMREVRLRSTQLVVEPATRRQGDVALARDVLDRQLVDVAGVQVVRAADVYLANGIHGWELAGVDVGLWALLRRLVPSSHCSPSPDRAIDWADLQAFVPRFDDTALADPDNPAASAGVAGSSVQLASPAEDLHRLRVNDVAALLEGLNRPQQAQLAALADPSVVAGALRELDPAKLEALLSELDDEDRSRLLGLLPQKDSA